MSVNSHCFINENAVWRNVILKNPQLYFYLTSQNQQRNGSTRASENNIVFFKILFLRLLNLLGHIYNLTIVTKLRSRLISFITCARLSLKITSARTPLLFLCVFLLVILLTHSLAQEIYEVQAGDTLSKIATKYGTSVTAISDANSITDPRKIRVGQRLKIPTQEKFASSTTSSTTTYIVQSGDTFYGISRKFGIPAQELIAANGLNESSILRVGQRLQIPGGGRGARGIGESRREEDQPAQATATPETTPAPTRTTNAPTTSAQKERVLEHRVVSGDTLSGISSRYGVSASAIAAANRISANSVLRIGQVLRIPADESVVREITTSAPAPQRTVVVPQAAGSTSAQVTEHSVRPGEGLQEIADLYGLDVADLREWNNIRPGQFLRVGQVIRLTPPDTGQTPRSQPARAENNSPQVTSSSGVLGRSATASSAQRSNTTSTAETSPPPRSTHQRSSSQPSIVYIRPVKSIIDRPRIRRARWRYVVVHHSETKSGNAKIFDRYHRNVKRWENGLAYHFVIGNGRGSGDGEIEVGQRWLDQTHGGHLRSQALNDIAIGICLVGSYNVERPTSRQIAATIELVEYLRRICGNPRLEFTIHRNINPTPTDCPGKLFPERSMFQRLR